MATITNHIIAIEVDATPATLRGTGPVARITVRRVLVVGALTGLHLLGGCTGSLNTSDELLDAPPLPALAAPGPASLPPGAGQPSLSAASGLDRRAWTTTEVSSPRGQVEHQPTYVTTFAPDRSLPRDRGEFPSKDSVLDSTGSGKAQAWEATANLVGTPLLIPAAPVQMLMGRWWWITVRDHPTYERARPTQDSDASSDPWIWIEPPSAKAG